MSIQPLGTGSLASGRPFAEGDRVVSFLVQTATGEFVRRDILESESEGYAPDGVVVCRWTRLFKVRPREGDAERSLKMSADNLFQTLADPSVEPSPDTTRMVQFLALMLERKRVLRPRGKTGDGSRLVYEHAATKRLFEVPAGELTPEFFVAVRGQLGVLVGEPAATA